MLTALRTSLNKALHLPAAAQADTREASDADRGFAAVMQRQVELQSPGSADPALPALPDTRQTTTDAAPAAAPPSSNRPPRISEAGPARDSATATSRPALASVPASASASNASVTLGKPEPPDGSAAVQALGTGQMVGVPAPASVQAPTPHSPVRNRTTATALQELAALSNRLATARDPAQARTISASVKPAKAGRESKVDDSVDANTGDITDTAASSQPDLQPKQRSAQTSDPLAQALMAGWQPAAINPPASSAAADPAAHDAAHDAGTPAQVTAAPGRPGVLASDSPPAGTARQTPTAPGPAVDPPNQAVGSQDRQATGISNGSGAGLAARFDRASKPEGDASRGPETARSATLAAVDARPARPAATVGQQDLGQQDLGQQDRGRHQAINNGPGAVIRPTPATGNGNTRRSGDAAQHDAPAIRAAAKPQLNALDEGHSVPGLPSATPTPTATPAPAPAPAPATVAPPPSQSAELTPAPHSITVPQITTARPEQPIVMAAVKAPQTPSGASADRATPGNTERLTETVREQRSTRAGPSGLQVAGPSTVAPEHAGNLAAPDRSAEVLAPSEQFAVRPNRADAAFLDHRRGPANSAESAPHPSSNPAMPTPDPIPEVAAIGPDPIRSTERQPASPNATPDPAPSAAPAATPPASVNAGVSTSPAPAEARIAAPVDSPAFAPALGAQVSLFVHNGLHSASLQLNPAEMGPVSVRIALEGSTAQVEFQADRASTRQAIEASLPALAAALRDAGINLAGGGVFEQHSGRQPPREDTAPSKRDGPQGRDFATGPLNRPVTRNQRRGLIDLVA